MTTRKNDPRFTICPTPDCGGRLHVEDTHPNGTQLFKCNKCLKTFVEATLIQAARERRMRD